jgi:hypothetical protein
MGKEGRRMNAVQIICTHVCKCKNDSCSKNWGKKKESSGVGEFKYDVFDTL